MSTRELDTLAMAIHPLWTQAKASPDYKEEPWMKYHEILVLTTTELARLRIELARYRKVSGLIQEIVMHHDENVPRGTT